MNDNWMNQRQFDAWFAQVEREAKSVKKWSTLGVALAVTLNLAWWGFVVWAIYTLVTNI